jgi:molybdopterin molybdotransferase
MLPVEEALARVLAVELPVRTETLPLVDAFGRVLAEPVVSTAALPPWDNSAMDGYAVRARDTGWAPDVAASSQPGCDGGDAPAPGAVLRVVSEIPAGGHSDTPLTPGTCARIFTGAPLPPGADAVVMQENTEALGDGRVRILGVARLGQHVRRAGEEVRPGDTLLEPGTALTGPRLSLVASVGQSQVAVARRPVVALLATGDELVSPGQPLGPGQIWTSNTVALAGLVQDAGGVPVDCGVAPDDPAGTRAAFRRALAQAPDLLVSTGGVSVGDFDVVKEALADVGADMRFWKVRMKPGKPLAFGVLGGVPAFGLPGNPVSCVVNFLQFVRPVIRRALGDPRPFLPVLDAVLDEPVRKKAGRNELVRVRLSWSGGRLHARTTGAQGSARIRGIADADGFLLLDAGATGAAAGDTVPVQLVDSGFLARSDAGYRWGGRDGA